MSGVAVPDKRGKCLSDGLGNDSAVDTAHSVRRIHRTGGVGQRSKSESAALMSACLGPCFSPEEVGFGSDFCDPLRGGAHDLYEVIERVQVYESDGDGGCVPAAETGLGGTTFEYFRLGDRVDPQSFEAVAYVVD